MQAPGVNLRPLFLRRNEARIQVEFVLAPFTEFHFVLGKSLAGPGGDAPLQIKTAEDRTSSLHCGGQAILCLLRSWGGLTQLMSPDGKRSKPPLATLVNSLYLKNAQIRVSVIFPFFPFFCLAIRL